MIQADRVFIDTSGFYALMDRSDDHHQPAQSVVETLVRNDAELMTHNYVVIETMALIQSRLGFEAAGLFDEAFLDMVDIIWIDDPAHQLAVELWRGLGRKKVSLVDCASFIVMRQNKIQKAFAFDHHFADQGFEVLS